MPRQCAAEVLESRYLLAVFTVTSLADNLAHGGKLTLRDAITAANMNAQPGAQDTIVFHAGLTGTIKLNPALGELLITQSVTIVGLGAKSTVIDAQHNSRVFDVAASAGNVTCRFTRWPGSTAKSGSSTRCSHAFARAAPSSAFNRNGARGSCRSSLPKTAAT
jgi:hypothetical protein